MIIPLLIVAALPTVAQAALIEGTPQHDELYGTPDHDRIFGRGGPDALYGGGHFNEMHGGPGNDWINGEYAGDLRGDADDDTVFNTFGSSAEEVRGNGGDDYLVGGFYQYAGTGNDQLMSGRGWDIMYGRDGDDAISSYIDGWPDSIYPGPGYDVCWIDQEDAVADDSCEELHVIQSDPFSRAAMREGDELDAANEQLRSMVTAAALQGLQANASKRQAEERLSSLFKAAGAVELMRESDVQAVLDEVG